MWIANIYYKKHFLQEIVLKKLKKNRTKQKQKQKTKKQKENWIHQNDFSCTVAQLNRLTTITPSTRHGILGYPFL